MKLKIEDNKGHVIIDDVTGKIISIMVRNVVEGKSDWHNFASFTNNHDGTHTATRFVK